MQCRQTMLTCLVVIDDTLPRLCASGLCILSQNNSRAVYMNRTHSEIDC